MKLWAVVLIACAWVPGTASAFRTLTDDPDLWEADGQPIGWTRWPIVFEVYSQPNDPVSGAGTQAALQEAIHLWDGSACASGAMEVGGLTNEPARAEDGRNTVQWVHERWDEIGPANAVAITDTIYQNKAGYFSVIEADIYVNAEKMAAIPVHWDVDMLAHLDGVIAHELGHAIGLAHPCELDGRDGAPLCGSVPMSLMHPQYDPRAFALTRDDEEAACWIYPEAAPREEPEVESACTVSRVHGGNAPSWPLLVVAMIGLLALVRRPRRCTGQA